MNSTIRTTLEPESQTNLLCFLVATVAASYSLTNEWRVDHVEESCRISLARNRVALPWLKRVTLGQLALRIARGDLRAAGIAVRQSNVQSMFTNEMGIDTASTLSAAYFRRLRRSFARASCHLTVSVNKLPSQLPVSTA